MCGLEHRQIPSHITPVNRSIALVSCGQSGQDGDLQSAGDGHPLMPNSQPADTLGNTPDTEDTIIY
jgi:hypothetical protein